jgi:uncharacterized membrane protein
MNKAAVKMTCPIRRNAINWSMTVLVSSLMFMLFVSCSRQPSYARPLKSGPDIIIKFIELKPETPKFYTYRYQGKSINFFVLKIQDRVLAFLDACASCYPHKQGYHYDSGSVTCRYCGVRFPVFKLEKGIGGCYPIKIEGRIEKDRFLLPVKILEEAADKF